MIKWLAENWNLVIGLTMTFAAVFVIPAAMFVHRLIEASVLRKAKKDAAELAEEVAKTARTLAEEHAKHRIEVIGKLNALEASHHFLVKDVGRVEGVTLKLDDKVDGLTKEFTKGFTEVHTTLELIKKGLNGFMKTEE